MMAVRLLSRRSLVGGRRSVNPALRRNNSTGLNPQQRDRLIRLEETANRKPDDPFAQEAFQRELVRNGYMNLAIARHESGKFATSDAVFRDARRAASNTFGRATEGESVSLGSIFDNASQNFRNLSGSSSSMFAANAVGYPTAAAARAGTGATEPLQVQIVEPDFRSQLLKVGRSVLTGIAFVVAFGLFFNASGGSIDGVSGGGPGIGGAGGGPRGLLGVRNYEIQPDADRKTFKDVKGSKEVKHELEKVVAYLREPSKFTRLGGKLPKGMLLTGPPGTGKTLIAKAVAGEAGVPFFYASGSEFEELYVGLGAKRVRDLFAAARKRAPCIIFIDEIDAVGSTRTMREHQAMKMTLNQLLVELDGFQSSQGVIVIAATNFPETLDPALIRPGRFDRTVAVPLPDVRARQEILSFYLEKVVKAPNINVETLARMSTGMSGADLANLINVGAIAAATANAPVVTQHHLEEAFDRVAMGNARASAVIPDEVRRVTAFHEGGHALVALRTEGSPPIHKATIVPRGPALGFVKQLPDEKDSMQTTKKQLFAMIDTCMAGRVAEEIIFGADNVTSGASNDLEKATTIARSMVGRFGMLPDSPVGLEVVDDKSAFDTRRLVDVEVRTLLDASYVRVKALLQKHRKDLDIIANALLEKETLTGEEIKNLIKA